MQLVSIYIDCGIWHSVQLLDNKKEWITDTWNAWKKFGSIIFRKKTDLKDKYCIILFMWDLRTGKSNV
jgi:hypothetical protein